MHKRLHVSIPWTNSTLDHHNRPDHRCRCRNRPDNPSPQVQHSRHRCRTVGSRTAILPRLPTTIAIDIRHDQNRTTDILRYDSSPRSSPYRINKCRSSDIFHVRGNLLHIELHRTALHSNHVRKCTGQHCRTRVHTWDRPLFHNIFLPILDHICTRPPRISHGYCNSGVVRPLYSASATFASLAHG